MSVPISEIIDIDVQVTQPQAVVSDFSTGLIIGNSTVLNAKTRVKVYTRENYSTQMVSDGFATTNGEFKAATAYFSQNPAPGKVCIGVKLDSETEAEAVTACRTFNADWYGFAFAESVEDSKIPAVALAIQSFENPAFMFYQTSDNKVLQASSTNVMATLQSAGYKYCAGFYSSADYFSCAVLGVFCGLNSTDAGSAYTMAFKKVIGYDPVEITSVQLDALKGYYGNAYVDFAKRYSFIYPGLVASGNHIDEVYFIDLSRSLIQENVIAGLITRKKIPQTESGLNDIITFISAACDTLANIGFVGSGIWNGEQVLDLNPGDAVAGGYLIQAGSMDSQSASDRAQRITPPIYVALKATGAIEHVVIRVFVNK